jgi:hypothetical protein
VNKLVEARLRELIKDIEKQQGKEAAIKAAISVAIMQFVKGEIHMVARKEIEKSELPEHLKAFIMNGVEESTNIIPAYIERGGRT